MRISAFILGFLGAIGVLVYGRLGYAYAMLAEQADDIDAVGRQAICAAKILSAAVPAVALLGAGIMLAKPRAGAALLGFVVAVMLWLFGVGVAASAPVILLATAVVLGMMDNSQAPRKRRRRR
jgi:hypothetical protein